LSWWFDCIVVGVYAMIDLKFPGKFYSLPTYGKALYHLCRYSTEKHGYLLDDRKLLSELLGLDVDLAMMAVKSCVEKGVIRKETNKLIARLV